jgi:predicted ABC-type ATPase
MTRRAPFIFVLAGVNGAGKSSVGGHLLKEQGLDWFDPDSLARFLMQNTNLPLEEANAIAWRQGRDALAAAIKEGRNFALETTLGANTIPQLLVAASKTHSVRMWYCGLASVEMHLQRVGSRVESGGHDIPEAKIRERWESSRSNVIKLLPYLEHLMVFDNSSTVGPGEPMPAPTLVLEVRGTIVRFPNRRVSRQIANTPAWARPIVEAAFQLFT